MQRTGNLPATWVNTFLCTGSIRIGKVWNYYIAATTDTRTRA